MEQTDDNAAGIEVAVAIAMPRGFTFSDITSTRKTPLSLVHTRQEIYWALQQELQWSAVRIGRLLLRDHSTVLCGIRKHCERVRIDFEPLPTRHAWTPGEDKRLVELSLAGIQLKAAAHILGRSRGAIEKRMQYLRQMGAIDHLWTSPPSPRRVKGQKPGMHSPTRAQTAGEVEEERKRAAVLKTSCDLFLDALRASGEAQPKTLAMKPGAKVVRGTPGYTGPVIRSNALLAVG